MNSVRFVGDGDDMEIDGSVVHLAGVINDYTLCGITMDGDMNTAGTFDTVRANKITCPSCVAIIKSCRGVKI